MNRPRIFISDAQRKAILAAKQRDYRRRRKEMKRERESEGGEESERANEGGKEMGKEKKNEKAEEMVKKEENEKVKGTENDTQKERQPQRRGRPEPRPGPRPRRGPRPPPRNFSSLWSTAARSSTTNILKLPANPSKTAPSSSPTTPSRGCIAEHHAPLGQPSSRSFEVDPSLQSSLSHYSHERTATAALDVQVLEALHSTTSNESQHGSREDDSADSNSNIDSETPATNTSALLGIYNHLFIDSLIAKLESTASSPSSPHLSDLDNATKSTLLPTPQSSQDIRQYYLSALRGSCSATQTAQIIKALYTKAGQALDSKNCELDVVKAELDVFERKTERLERVVLELKAKLWDLTEERAALALNVGS